MKALKDKISRVFEDFPEVQFGYLFGSWAEGTEGPLSDLDIAVYMEPYSHESYIRLHTALARALKRSDIDLLALNRTKNLILLEEIITKGILLYEKDPSKRIEYEAMTIHKVIDFKSHRKAVLGI